MKKTIFGSNSCLTVHGPNASFGNHMLHMMFTLNMSVKRDLNLKIATNTNLEELFDLSELKSDMPSDAFCFFAEAYGGDYSEYSAKDLANIIDSHRLLYDNNINLPNNFWVDGWFHNSSLFPAYSDFSKLKIKTSVLEEINIKYGHIFNDTHISLHYRGTDFANCAYGWGDVRLSAEYYLNSLNFIRTNKPHIQAVNIFTEDKAFYENIGLFESTFPTLKFNIISDEYYKDWLCLHLSKNIICSNSTFCLAAAAYNKNLIIQPKKFLLREKNTNISVPTNPFFSNSYII
jgi:hypothetical protein